MPPLGWGVSVVVEASAELWEDCDDCSVVSGTLIEECVSSAGCVRW